jgi:hypothetical protein
MNLAELQSKFQAGILEGDQAILVSIKDSPVADRATLFGVYFNAYRLRLAEFLANDFPILRAYLGEEAFGHLVEDYIESTPSRLPNARWYGTRLPDLMQEAPAWRKHARAIDLAKFERALSDAFDAADAPAAAILALQEMSVEDWPDLTFEFHASVALLELGAGTAQTYAALADGERPPAAGQGRETILFWRNQGQSFYRPVAEDERLALSEAMHRKRFAEICALPTFQKNGDDVPQRVAGFLFQWFAGGLISRVSIAG